jgi:hypothetical protein
MIKMFSRLLAATAATVALTATIAAPVFAAQNAVPFKANYEGTLTWTIPMQAADLSGSGNGTHLGNSQLQGAFEVVSPATTCEGFNTRHLDTLTAANGDQLFVEIHDLTCAVAPGLYHCVGTYTVTGGTGRFEGATGEGDFLGDVNFGASTFKLAFSGTVSQPNGN